MKVLNKLFFLIVIFFFIILPLNHSNSIEFRGKFLQGHFIVGMTDPHQK